MTLRFVPGVDPDGADHASAGDHWFAFRGPDLLVADAEAGAVVPTAADPAEFGVPVVRSQYLGRLGTARCWSAELPADVAPPVGMRFAGLRALHGLLPEPLFGIAGRAFQIIAWDRDHQFCGRCGKPMERAPGERARRCPACGLVNFPRISPAVIMLVERAGRILLARGPGSPPGRFAVLAGFVEAGESLEEAVRREVREEVGLEIDDPVYFGSQPWPFPHTIMIGFTAHSAAGEFALDPAEIVEAGWFGGDDLPRIPPKLSIARRLIDAWAERNGYAIPEDRDWER